MGPIPVTHICRKYIFYGKDRTKILEKHWDALKHPKNSNSSRKENKVNPPASYNLLQYLQFSFILDVNLWQVILVLNG